MSNLTFIESTETHDTGGNVMNDVIHLKSGMILVVTDEVVCCYSDRDYQLGLDPLWCVAEYDTDGFELLKSIS